MSMKKNLDEWTLDVTELSGGLGICVGGGDRWGIG